MQVTNTSAPVVMPSILEANTYFWSSSANASSRRSNEERNQANVASFFASLGLEVSRSGDSVNATGKGLEISFHYSESCKNVYKSLEITRNGKRSNITALRKLVAA